MSAPLAPFTLPDRYRLERGIAAGGMAAVYAAHDELLDRPVAVKVLAEHLNEDDSARQRFQREARAAAGLSSHPNVVTIFDVGEHEGRSFIVMERGVATVGDELRKNGRIDPERALRWLRETASALDAAHERGVVHRDIKPANLLLDEHDKVAVADFGIARLAYESDQFTQTGQVLGTAAYISPEQATGEAATAASDRYALAVLAFELLTGERPFTGEHFAAQARAHIEDPVPRASELATALPASVDDVLSRGMHKDPAERWPTAVAFVDALERAAGAPAAVAAPADETASTQMMPASTPVGTRGGNGTFTRRPAAGPRRDRPWGAIIATVALLGIALVALVLALSGAGNDGNGGEQAADQPRETKKEQAEKTPEAEPTAASTTAPEPTPTPETAPASGDPGQLNAEGYELFQQGQYAESVPYFQKALDACGGGGALDPCGYATFNLGAALNRSGRPDEAIPILQQRLEGWDNQKGTVKKELKAACEAAGQKCKD